MSKKQVRIILTAAAITAVPSLCLAGGTVDGTLAANEYAFTLAVQNTPTGFGDNQSELNAAFAEVLSDGSIRLMFTGNLEENGNGLVFFLDSRAGGAIANILPGGFGELGSIGGAKTDDWGTDTDGGKTSNNNLPSILSPGFNPDMSIETNAFGGTGDYFVNIIDLTVPNEPLPNRDVFLGQHVFNQPSTTQTYLREPTSTPFGTIEHAFNNTNTAGVIAFDFANPPGALGDPLSATTGYELNLSSLFVNADPLQEIRILPFITNDSGGFLSNQFLPGVDGLTNLGGPGDPGGTPLFDVRTMTNSNNFYLTIPLPTWTGASGVWSTDGAWNTQHAPNGVNASAVIAGTGGAIEVQSPVTVGGIGFRTANGYIVSGPSVITLDTHPRFDGSARPARLEATAGSHTISAAMNWNQNVIASVAANSTLTLSNTVTVAAGRGLTKDGTGVLGMRNLRMSSVNVQQGTVRVTAGGTNNDPAKLSVIDTLTIAGTPSAPTARLDLTNNSMVVNNPPPLNDVRQLILAGASGPQNGISTSSGNTNTHGLGYATAGSVNITNFLGEQVDPTDLLIRFTRYGDANLDALVNISDFNRLAANFNLASGAVWSQGDFNYDGRVNITDFNLLAANFNLTASPDGPTPEDWATLAAVVPEPASVALLSLGTLPLLRRRRI